MKAGVVSDLHFELQQDGGLTLLKELHRNLGGIDILILAGDVSESRDIITHLEFLCGLFKEVVFVLGNHDLFHGSFSSVRKDLKDRAPKNLHFLDNEVYEVGGRRLVGSTMFYPHHWDNQFHHRDMADFEWIKGFVNDVYAENATAQYFLKTTVRRDDIVITHHLPTPRSILPAYSGHPLNRFFLCDMSDVIVNQEPAIWIHGHTHSSLNYKLFETQIICNPFGNPDGVNKDFDPGFVIEI